MGDQYGTGRGQPRWVAYAPLLNGIGLSLIWLTSVPAASLQPREQTTLNWGLALLAAVFTWALITDFRGVCRWMPRLPPQTAVGGAMILASSFIALFILRSGVVHIGGYDQSLLINVAWAQQQGMRPCIDFPCSLPPLFFLGAKYAFDWFGARFQSFVILCALVAVPTFLWSYALLRALSLPRWQSLLLAFTTEATTMLVSSYFWHNDLTSLCVVLLFLSALAWSVDPRSWLCVVSFGFAAFLVLLNKPNGWTLPAMLAVILACSRPHRLRLGLCACGIIVSILVLATATGFDLMELLRTYTVVARYRGLDAGAIDRVLRLPYESMQNYVDLIRLLLILAVFLMMALGCLWFEGPRGLARRGLSPTNLVYAAAILTGIGLYVTNIELKLSDLTLPIIALGVWAFRSQQEKQWWPRAGWLFRTRSAMATWLVLFALASALLFGWNRYRVRIICDTGFWEPHLASNSPPLELFNGVHSGPRLVGLVRDMKRVIRENPHASVFFGPWIEFGYAGFEKDVPAGLPVWWHNGASYGEEDADALAERWRDCKFEMLILFRWAHLYRMPARIDKIVREEYEPESRNSRWRDLEVYFRKGRRSAAGREGVSDVELNSRPGESNEGEDPPGDGGLW